MSVYFQDLCHQTALRWGLLQRHNSFSWWSSSREPTCAGSPGKNELWRCSGIWLHSLMVWYPVDHSWVELSIQMDYSQLVMGRSGSQTELSKGKLKTREPQILDFHYILLDMWNSLGLWFSTSACQSSVTQLHLPSVLLNYQGFFPCLVFSCKDQVGWAQSGQVGWAHLQLFVVIT